MPTAFIIGYQRSAFSHQLKSFFDGCMLTAYMLILL